MKIKDKIKRLSAVVCAVLVGSLSCLPAFASHIPSAPTSEYINFYASDKKIECSSIDDIYNSIGFDFFPFTTYSSNYLHYNMDDVENWLSNHSNINEIVFYMQNKSGDISINSFIYDVNEIAVTYDGSNIIMNNLTSDIVNFVISGLPSFVKSDSGYTSTLSYAPYTSLGNLTISSTYKYPNNTNYTPLKLISSNADICDSSGNVVVKKEVKPVAWEYTITYSPILSENMSDIKEIALTVSLSESSVKFCEENYMQVDILPFVSTVNASEDLKGSFDNAKAVIPTKSNYTDGFTLTASKGAEGAHSGYWTFDKAYGNNVLYTLCEDNNYSLTLTLPITSTPLISNTDYYFNIVGIQHCYLLMKTTGNMPARAQFKKLYENGINSSLYDDINVISANVMSSEKFTFSSVLKKTDNKNGVGEGGLIMSTINSLNTTPSTVNPYGTDNYISYDEVDDYNESIKEEYFPNYNNSSAFDTSSLDGLFKSSSGFFDLLKKGFSILPSFIWLLIAGFITVLIFLRVMGR